MAYSTQRYDNLYTEFEKKQKENVEKQKAQTTEDYNKQLKEAYISKMQNQRALNENLEKAGIRGGATETSNIRLAANYQGTRNSLNEQKNKALQQIDDTASDNLFNYKQTNDAAKLSYIEQREAEDRQLAQAAAEEKKAADLDLLQAKYGGIYSISTLDSAYKKATTPQEKAIIQARKNYLNQYKKGY